MRRNDLSKNIHGLNRNRHSLKRRLKGNNTIWQFQELNKMLSCSEEKVESYEGSSEADDGCKSECWN